MARTSKYTSEQRDAHIVQWKSSGLNQTDYCKQHGITYHLFNKWAGKSRATPPTKKIKITRNEKKFIPIVVTEPPGVSGSILIKVEIEFPDGTKLRIH